MADDKKEKTPRENQQKEENKYKSGAANKKTKADSLYNLSFSTFIINKSSLNFKVIMAPSSRLLRS